MYSVRYNNDFIMQIADEKRRNELATQAIKALLIETNTYERKALEEQVRALLTQRIKVCTRHHIESHSQTIPCPEIGYTIRIMNFRKLL